MKEKSKSGKHKKDASQSRRKNDEEQILINELEKNLKKEIVGGGLFILAIYIFFMDCDL